MLLLQNRLLIFILLFAANLQPRFSYGACTSPAANAGAREMISGALKLCDGNNWIDFHSDGTAGGCSTSGQLEYDGGLTQFKYCNGSSWIKIGESPCAISSGSLSYVTKASGGYLSAVNAISVSPDGSRVYTASETNGFVVWNVAEGATPLPIGSISNGLLSNASSNAVGNNHVFVTSRGSQGVAVIDVSNPVSPSLVRFAQPNVVSEMRNANSIALSDDGNYGYVASWDSGPTNDKCFFHVLNLTTPSSATVMGTLNVSAANANIRYCNTVLTSGTLVYMSHGDFSTPGIATINVTNPAAPTYVADSTTTTVNGYNIYELQYNYNKTKIVATSWSTNKIMVWDINQTTKMPSLNSFGTSATYLAEAYSAKVSGNYAIVAGATSDAISAWDISTSGTVAIAAGTISAANINEPVFLAVEGRYAYAACKAGASLSVVNLGCEPNRLASCSQAGSIEYVDATKTLIWCDGSYWRPMSPAANDVVTVTLTSGVSWTVPAGVTKLETIEAWGAGGGAAYRTSGYSCGGGGGGGYSKAFNVAVTPGSNLTYALGSGGTSATGGGTGSPGQLGGDTYLLVGAGTAVLAKGGSGAAAATCSGSGTTSGGLATAGIGSVKFNGGSSGNAGGFGGSGGGGAGSPFGAGGSTGNSSGSVGFSGGASVSSGTGGVGGSAGAPPAAGGAGGAGSNGGGGGGGGGATTLAVFPGASGGGGGYPGGGAGGPGGGTGTISVSSNPSGTGGSGQIVIKYLQP